MNPVNKIAPYRRVLSFAQFLGYPSFTEESTIEARGAAQLRSSALFTEGKALEIVLREIILRL